MEDHGVNYIAKRIFLLRNRDVADCDLARIKASIMFHLLEIKKTALAFIAEGECDTDDIGAEVVPQIDLILEAVKYDPFGEEAHGIREVLDGWFAGLISARV